MYLYHNARDSRYRSPYGAAPVGETITLRLKTRGLDTAKVLLRVWTDRERLVPMKPLGDGVYEGTLTPDAPGLFWYYFRVDTPEGSVFYGRGQGGEGIKTASPESWQITAYVPQKLPEWYQNAVVYQIFPDRFARGTDWRDCQAAAAHPAGWKGPGRLVVQDWDDTPFYCRDEKGRVTRWPFFGGTLRGIQEKLSYLKSLGIGAIYLNPIFLASSNHKYDTADYLTLDPGFGTEADFTALCARARELGIRVILDGVFSHTGDDSVYFNRWGNFPNPGAASPEKSPYDRWYRFDEEQPAGYACWWGVDSLPEVEETEESYREFICGENGVIRKWLRLGASGWRLDVADELPDEFIEDIRRAALAEKPDALILGEVWEDASHKESYGKLRRYFLGTELDCTMHYPFRVGAIDFLLGTKTAGEFAEAMEQIRENYPPTALQGALNLAGTHDTPRILTLLGEAKEPKTEVERERFRLTPEARGLAVQRVKLMDILLFTVPGVPCVYYGDEAGMEGFADPFNRGTFPWGKEDGGLQYHVRMLSALRKEYPVLARGETQYLSPEPAVFGLRRSLGNTEALIYVNRSGEEKTISLPGGFQRYLELLSGKVFAGERLTLPPLSGAILYREGEQADFSPLPASARTPAGKGILCPVFSLPSGTLGDAERFLDALRREGYQSWMLLPLCPAGDGNSPYSSRALFAGNPELLGEAAPCDWTKFPEFCAENADWLEDYALYTLLRENNGKKPWQEWPEAERDRTALGALREKFHGELTALKRRQYQFFEAFTAVRETANRRGIALIGDLPIYAAVDSADTWAHRELFLLDGRGYPTLRAGCPPDYFTPEGQDWGNPLYNWAAMEQDGYRWWTARLKKALSMYDYVRLDHFRGFAAYYAIPQGKTAKEGYWMKGPGIALFRALQRALGEMPIVAEDLGALDSQVTTLLRHTGLSGMNVWQFTPEEMETLPPEEAAHRVYFSGTHDNQTLRSFLADSGDGRSPETVLRGLASLPASAVIFPVQDVLGLGDEARINVPGVPEGNWKWRMTEGQLSFLAEGGIL